MGTSQVGASTMFNGKIEAIETYPFTLSDDLRRIKLCNNRLQYFIHNRRQYTFVVVGTERLQNLGQGFDVWA